MLTRSRRLCCELFLKSRLNAPQNCYCVGRKAHLLEDKQIPSVGVFDEVSFYALFRGHLTPKSFNYPQIMCLIVCFCVFSTWMTFGGNTRDLGSFGEETDKITDLHGIAWNYYSQNVETASGFNCDAV